MCKTLVIIIALPLILFAAQWQSLNGPPAGRADDVSIGKDDGTYYIYAADDTHWLYRSTDLGMQWDSIPKPYTDKPTCVVTLANDGRKVYIGRSDNNPTKRVMRSANGGDDWDDAGGTDPNWVSNPNPLSLTINPNDTLTIYLGCESGDCAMFKTEDGGDNWSKKEIDTTATDPAVSEIAIKPNYPNTLCIATDEGIYLSCSVSAHVGHFG